MREGLFESRAATKQTITARNIVEDFTKLEIASKTWEQAYCFCFDPRLVERWMIGLQLYTVRACHVIVSSVALIQALYAQSAWIIITRGALWPTSISGVYEKLIASLMREKFIKITFRLDTKHLGTRCSGDFIVIAILWPFIQGFPCYCSFSPSRNSCV